METSRHVYTDKYGYRCAVDIINEDDDTVVFDSTPHLSFDFKKYGIQIRRFGHYDYVMTYVIKNGRIYLRGFEARPSFVGRNSQIRGLDAEVLTIGKQRRFLFNDIPTDYSGILRMGKGFDDCVWKHDEKAMPVPFSSDVYKENGYMKFEKGIVVEKELNRKED